jgi:2-keto-4-pentenoate hydratase
MAWCGASLLREAGFEEGYEDHVLDIDPRLRTALDTQWRERATQLERGARRVGWKLGMGERERIAGHIAVGYLTTATRLDAGGCYLPDDGADLHVDAEVAVELGADLDESADADAAEAATRACWPALEVVDLAPQPDEPDSVVAGNIFHRAVAFGTSEIPLLAAGRVTAWVNGELRACAPWPADIAERIAAAAATLAAAGERLRAGERVITGSTVQVPVRPGDRIEVAFGSEASIALTIGRPA